MGNLNLSDGNKCPICGELNCSIWVKDIHDPFYYYDCKKCGGFFVPDAHRTICDYEGVKNKFNLQHLQSYLFYHKSHLRPVICEKEYFDKHITDEFVQIYNITPEMVESWYPKNFAEKIDLILSQLHSQTEYIGQSKTYNYIVHSLISALSRYSGVKFVLISPAELAIPKYVRYEILENSSASFFETTSLEEVIPTLDVLYMTRIQRERFFDEAEYERLKDSYVLTVEKLENAKKDLSILHPLPRVNEISVKIDSDPRACYFKQVENGKYMRMALILKLLQDAENDKTKKDEFAGKKLVVNKFRCDNPRCISSTEQELEHVFKLVDEEKQIYRCFYCEAKAKNN